MKAGALQERAGTHWLAVAAAVLCGVAVASNVGKVSIMISALREDFGLSLVEAGWLSSAINVLAVSAAVVFGFSADRIGGLRLCLAGIGFGLAGGAASLLAASFPLLLAARVVEGAGYMAVAVSAPILLSAASRPDDRRFVLGVWAAYMPGGIGLVMIAAPLLQGVGGWRAIWWFAIALLAAGGASVWLQRRHYGFPGTSGANEGAFAVVREVMRQPLAWTLGLLFATWALQHFTLIVWLPTFLREQRGLDMAWVAALSCVMVLANVPGNVIGGALLRRGVARGKLLVLGSGLSGLCMYAAFSPGLPDAVRYLACVAVSFVGGLIPSSILSASTVIARTPRQIGTFQGLSMQIANLGQLLGPPLIAALVAGRGSWEAAAALPVGAAALGTVLGMAAWRMERGYGGPPRP
ncbi:MFS transporter [Thauera linaloolentis 47Lol = DSM 12138]|uniref:MFS transporter n=2 Tax=Thauera linaloolentis TaxID=76112 RepID=N6Z720_THAL4|nr:MFS transporter [Thauera linaloolentis]ENO87964.1 MFS transporter [Thauera linaloolentis 47Lol = DSM 12138]